MTSQLEKAQIFKRLHERNALFVLPNPWDVGSAKMLAGLGFEALATTSAGFAFSQGKLDRVGVMQRDDALQHARDIVQATNLPVSADLENGYGDAPEAVQKTIFAAAEAGLVGCTIEDTTGLKDKPIYEKAFAIERITAAVEAVASLDFPFTLTARAENYLHGRPDLDDTIARLQGYEEVGADVLYAPGLPDIDTIKSVCDSVTKPVSVGSSLARTAIGSMIKASKAILEHGTFDAFETAASFTDIETLIERGTVK